jgi:hypothetical protein
MKLLSRFILFLVFLSVIQFSLDSIFLNTLLRSNFRFSEIYNDSKSKKYDAVCFGNSRGVNSFFTPSINNVNSKFYNFSYNGLNIQNISTLLMDFVDSNNTSKHVFIEISTIFNSNKENSFSKLNLYSSLSDRIGNGIKNSDYNLYLISKYLPLYKYNNELYYRVLYYLNKSDQNWVNEYRISQSLIDKVNKMNDFDLQLNEKDLNELNRLLAFLNSKNIETTLYIAPYLPSYRSKISNYESNLKKIELYLNTEVLDLSLYITEQSYFADRVHTNKKGAILITKKLLNDYILIK